MLWSVTFVTFAALNTWSNFVCTHTCSNFLEEAHLTVIQDGENWSTNEVVDSVKYIWSQATPLAVELGVGWTHILKMFLVSRQPSAAFVGLLKEENIG